jgi:hypothetical protein
MASSGAHRARHGATHDSGVAHPVIAVTALAGSFIGLGAVGGIWLTTWRLSAPLIYTGVAAAAAAAVCAFAIGPTPPPASGDEVDLDTLLAAHLPNVLGEHRYLPHPPPPVAEAPTTTIYPTSDDTQPLRRRRESRYGGVDEE